jgi:hypothetical protein
MRKTGYTIRTMTRQEVDMAVDWAATEGWNPGLHDADCFYAADSYGFLVGLLGDEPIATVSGVKYGDSYGFLAFYIVKPEYRGMGYGIQMANAAFAYLEGRVMGLDGVTAQEENYKKTGFSTAYHNLRYQGVGGGNPATDPEIVPLSTIPFDEICAYDRPFFPDERERFLRCWIDQPQSAALGMVRNRSLLGYGVVRRCRSGYKVGPLFADSPEFAERLFLALKAHVPEGDPIFLDTPQVNSAAVELAERHNMTVCFETARMYRGGAPELPIPRLFGVTTFELG